MAVGEPAPICWQCGGTFHAFVNRTTGEETIRCGICGLLQGTPQPPPKPRVESPPPKPWAVKAVEEKQEQIEEAPPEAPAALEMATATVAAEATEHETEARPNTGKRRR